MVLDGYCFGMLLMVSMLAACGTSSSDDGPDDGAGTASTSPTGSTSGTASSAEITGDPGPECPSNGNEAIVVTPEQIAMVLGPGTPVTEDNCLEVCVEYSTADYSSDPDHNWSLSGCSITPMANVDDDWLGQAVAHGGGSTGGGGDSSSTDASAEGSTGSAGDTTAGDATGSDGEPVALTCYWFPGCM